MIVTRNSIEYAVRRLSEEPRLSLDTETTGLRPYHDSKVFCITIASSTDAFLFNFFAYAGMPDEDVLGAAELEHLLKLFQDKTKTWYIHNAQFDLAMLRRTFGVAIEGSVFCTIAQSRVLFNEYMDYSLSALAKTIGMEKDDAVDKYIKEHGLFTLSLLPGKKVKERVPHFEKVPPEVLFPYALQDARVTYDLGVHTENRIASFSESKFYPVKSTVKRMYDISLLEKKLTRVLHEVQNVGIGIDVVFCKRALEHEKRTYNAAAKLFTELSGKEFVDSSKQLSNLFLGSDESKWTELATALGVSLTEKTKKPSWDSDSLKKYGGELAETVLKYRDAKARANFLSGFIYHVDRDSRIHPQLNQAGTATGRFCIRKGTPIDVVRDCSLYPDGIPIEDVKVGDLAYTYDQNRNLTLRKVIWSGKTGKRKLIRLHWLGAGRKKTGFLDLTENHEVRMIDGSYKRASEIKEKDRVLAMGRSDVLGYCRIHSRDMEFREQTFIGKELGLLTKGMVAHHKDENKKNNALGNLSFMKRSEHSSFHAKKAAPLRKELNSTTAKRNWRTGAFKVVKGKENPNFKEVTRFGLLRGLVKSGGRLTLFEGAIKDFGTVKRKFTEKGLDTQHICKFFNKRGERLSKKKVLHARYLEYPENLKYLGVNFYKFKWLCEQYNIPAWNHLITKVEYLEEEDDVYDLEIEETHNFIANEVCVHNSSSSPNFQNLRKEDKDKTETYEWSVRKALVPAPGYFLASLDYDQMEYRLMLEYAGETSVIKSILNEGLDVHEATASIMGVSRQEAKTINFMLLYGGGVQKLADALGIPYSEAYEKKQLYFKKLPKVSKFVKNVVDRASKRGFVITWAGRLLNFPDPEFAYKAPNYLIQGGCADVAKTAFVNLHEFLRGWKSRVILNVHDEFVFEIHNEEEHLLPQLQKIMTEAYPARVLPLTCGVSISRENWGTLREYEAGNAVS